MDEWDFLKFVNPSIRNCVNPEEDVFGNS